MRLSLLRPALLALPLLALAPVSDELAFRPKADAEVAKELAIELELGLDDFTLSINGQDIGSEGMGDMDDAHVLLNVDLGVTDKYVQVKDGAVRELLRTFDAIALRAELGPESQDNTDVDAFEGKTVRFLWDDEKKEHVKSVVDAAGEEALLAGLEADMDLTRLLPEKKVSDGDTWDVKGDALADLFFPGGSFPVTEEDGESGSDEALDGLLEELVKKLGAITVHCTYKGAHEDGKVKVGEIAFRFDGKADLDLAGMLEDAIAEDAPEEVPDLEITSTLELRGEGKLLWDLASGHLHAYEMSSDLGLEADIGATLEQQGQSLEMKAHVGASGQGTWSLVRK
jgi:hypothetical protein